MKTFVGWLTCVGGKSVFTFKAGKEALTVTQPAGVELVRGRVYEVGYEPLRENQDPSRYHPTMMWVAEVETGQTPWSALNS